jgi:hypothetical protein
MLRDAIKEKKKGFKRNKKQSKEWGPSLIKKSNKTKC